MKYAHAQDAVRLDVRSYTLKVKSDTTDRHYVVCIPRHATSSVDASICTCLDSRYRRRLRSCKHIKRAELFLSGRRLEAQALARELVEAAKLAEWSQAYFFARLRYHYHHTRDEWSAARLVELDLYREGIERV